MALVLKDRVKETSTTAGTGTITLAGAVAGFQSFSVVGNGNTTYYAIVDATTGAWEVGIGTYTSSGTTLSRTTVLSSSNGGSLVSFAGNAKDVFVTYPSSKSVYLDGVDVVAQQTFGAITATSAALTTGTITTAPTNNTDIVNKAYADAIASGIHFHEAVALATNAALPANTYNNGTSGVGATLTGNANGALSVDSTLTIASERILVKNEAAGANNGVYTVTQVGSAGTPYILTRATDFDAVGTGVDQIDEGDFFLVTSGTANTNTAWVQQTAPPIVVGTTPIVFQQFSSPVTYTAGTGLNESPTYTFNIANTGVAANTYGSASTVPVFAVNAQGQLTSVTNTSIAINGSAVSGNISGQAGSVANSLTAGTYLTGTAYNGSAAQTWTVDATSANTASKVVARNSSGDFSAGTITATLSGAATSAGAATNLAGGAANQIPYQTASGTTSFITAASGTNYVLNYTGATFNWVAGTISGVSLGSNLNALTLGTYLTGTSYNGSSAVTAAVDATSANTASKVVARDASGDFSAGIITSALNGNASTATNVAGGAANKLVYNSAASTTAFADAPTTAGQVLGWNGSAFAWTTAGAAGITYIVKTANYTAVNNEGVLANTSGGSFIVTLPATPSVGNTVIVADPSSNWATNNLTVGRNGSTIANSATDLICNISGVSVQLIYDGTTWEVYAQIGGNSGTVVTESGTQTLINKTISGASNTITNISLTAGVTGTLPVVNGGTGAASLTSNNVLLGNGTSAVQTVAPGTTGNVLTSNGTTWQSTAPTTPRVGYLWLVGSGSF